jgi:rod shape-determining protein MreD
VSALRALVVGGLVVLAVVLQAAFLPPLAWNGVVPDLALLVVVAAGLVRGPDFGASAGFVAGLLLDLAPPAEHTVGRWVIALVLVGWLAGRVRGEGRRPVGVVFTVAACSFVGVSVYALLGAALGDPVGDVAEMLGVIGTAVLLDVLLTPLLVPVVMRVLGRLDEQARQDARIRRDLRRPDPTRPRSGVAS